MPHVRFAHSPVLRHDDTIQLSTLPTRVAVPDWPMAVAAPLGVLLMIQLA